MSKEIVMQTLEELLQDDAKIKKIQELQQKRAKEEKKREHAEEQIAMIDEEIRSLIPDLPDSEEAPVPVEGNKSKRPAPGPGTKGAKVLALISKKAMTLAQVLEAHEKAEIGSTEATIKNLLSTTDGIEKVGRGPEATYKYVAPK